MFTVEPETVYVVAGLSIGMVSVAVPFGSSVGFALGKAVLSCGDPSLGASVNHAYGVWAFAYVNVIVPIDGDTAVAPEAGETSLA
jgi:hypothetical protein